MQTLNIKYKPLRQKAIKLFRKQWRLMANGMSKKDAYELLLKDSPFEDELLPKCFLCDYRDYVRYKEDNFGINCSKLCPIIWDNDTLHMACIWDNDIENNLFDIVSKKPVKRVKYVK